MVQDALNTQVDGVPMQTDANRCQPMEVEGGGGETETHSQGGVKVPDATQVFEP